MDLILVSSNVDAIAVKTPYCKTCVQNKLNLTIIKTWSIEPAEYKQFGVKGYNISCDCGKK